MADLFYMGGYAFYIWVSYAVVAVVLGYHYVAPLVRRRRLLAEITAELSAPQQPKLSPCKRNESND